MTKRRCQQGLCNAPHVVALSRGTNELTGPVYYFWWLKFTAAVEGGSLPSRRLYNTSQGVQQCAETLPCSPKCYHKPLTKRKPFRHKTLPCLHSSLVLPLLIMLQLQILLPPIWLQTSTFCLSYPPTWSKSPRLSNNKAMTTWSANWRSLGVWWSAMKGPSQCGTQGELVEAKELFVDVCYSFFFWFWVKGVNNLVIITLFPHVEKSWVLPVSPEIWSDDQLGGWKVGNSSRD